MEVEVRFRRPIEEVFDYLVDPRNRSEWQSSLRRIEPADPGTPGPGQTWTDVTTVGVRPAMRVTAFVEPLDGTAVWAEEGTWRGISARLRLDFRSAAEGTLVLAEFDLTGPAALRPVTTGLGRLARYAVRGDLRRAAGLLATDR